METEEERQRIREAGFGQRVGFGDKAAVIVIDVQNYMIGPPEGSSVGDYPSSCGATGAAAVDRLGELLSAARSCAIPVFYTKFVLARDGSDAGVYALKRKFLQTEGWCLEDSEGAEIVDRVTPERGDIVFVKKKPSAFHGTPLLGLLLSRKIDTVIVTGGSTSNCVRATAVDAASYNLRVIVAGDCVFDRVTESHRVALADLDRQYGDVMPSSSIISWARGRSRGAGRE